jgi:hypothetical protein
MVNELGLWVQAWVDTSFLTAKYAKGRERRLGLRVHFLTTENTEYTEVVDTSFETTNLHEPNECRIDFKSVDKLGNNLRS